MIIVRVAAYPNPWNDDTAMTDEDRRQIMEHDREMAEPEALDAEHYDATHADEEQEDPIMQTEMDFEDGDESQRYVDARGKHWTIIRIQTTNSFFLHMFNPNSIHQGLL